MVEFVKRWIFFQIKTIEFRVRTWKNAYNISRAYSTISVSSLKKLYLRRSFKKSFFVIAIIVISSGVLFLLIKNVGFQILKNPEAAIADPKIRISAHPTERSADLKKNLLRDEILHADSFIKKPAVTPVTDSLRTFSSTDTVAKKNLKNEGTLFIYDSSAIPVTGNDNDFKVIVANKAIRTLFLFEKNRKGSWNVVRTYYMAIGSQSGRKETAGDKRTPEGVYLIIERKEKYELSSIYGPLAYVLDYPNKRDREEGRTGQGIWIHGTEKDSVPVETKGCLEIDNSDLTDLSLLLKTGKGTPVIIVNDSTLKNPVGVIDTFAIKVRRKEFFDSVNRIQEEFSKFVSDWKIAWESKNIERYSNFYHHTQFSVQGMEWETWKEKKKQTFMLYDTIEVTYGNISLSDITDSTAVLKFSQSYKTEKVKFENNKRLDLEKERGMWKITREAAF